jgi:hypothetical protein
MLTKILGPEYLFPHKKSVLIRQGYLFRTLKKGVWLVKNYVRKSSWERWGGWPLSGSSSLHPPPNPQPPRGTKLSPVKGGGVLCKFLTGQRRFFIAAMISRKNGKTEKNSEVTRSEREEKNKLRNFQPARPGPLRLRSGNDPGNRSLSEVEGALPLGMVGLAENSLQPRWIMSDLKSFLAILMAIFSACSYGRSVAPRAKPHHRYGFVPSHLLRSPLYFLHHRSG